MADLESQPLAIGYVAPVHGRGAMSFLLLGMFAFLLLLAGALSPSLGLAMMGAAGMLLAAGGFALYWKLARHWPLALLYPDRLEFVRGPQRGTVRFADVTAVHQLQWEKSLFPYNRGSRVLVLVTPEAEWQVGTEIAEYAAFQQSVGLALEAFSRQRA